jgi:hypothetical protein
MRHGFGSKLKSALKRQEVIPRLPGTIRMIPHIFPPHLQIVSNPVAQRRLPTPGIKIPNLQGTNNAA